MVNIDLNGVNRAARQLDPAFLVRFFYGLWPAPLHEPHMGLAVSGGVDSMCLAYLCKEMIKLHNAPTWGIKPTEFKFTAFVCDHRMREGSTEEAHKVAGWLRDQMRLNTSILTLPAYEQNSTKDGRQMSPEQWARKHRYQALGKICHERGIRQLLLGHHGNDNHETALLRLSQGRTMRNMSAVANIPECHGIYGVSQSGKEVRGGSPLRAILKQDKEVHADSEKIHDIARIGRLSYESGGIQLLRPFLTVLKRRLASTCSANNVPWVEDPTNADKTFTVRNAIRHLAGSKNLPEGLQIKHLTALTHGAGETRYLGEHDARVLISKWRPDLDNRSGTLRINMSAPIIYDVVWAGRLKGEHYRFAIGHVLKHLLSLVSPDETIDLGKCMEHATRWRPMLNPAEEGYKDAVDSFTLAGVWVRPSNNTLSGQEEAGYVFSRVPYRRNLSDIPVLTIPPQASSSNLRNVFSPWQLWDNRFWIRVLNPSKTSPLYIRPVADAFESPLETFESAWGNSQKTTLRQYLQEVTHRGDYAGFPAIAAGPDWFGRSPDTGNKDETKKLTSRDEEIAELKRKAPGTLVAMPTIGLALPEVRKTGFNWKGGIDWEIRYRSIDLPPAGDHAAWNGDMLSSVPLAFKVGPNLTMKLPKPRLWRPATMHKETKDSKWDSRRSAVQISDEAERALKLDSQEDELLKKRKKLKKFSSEHSQEILQKMRPGKRNRILELLK